MEEDPGMQIKEWNLDVLGDLPQDLDDVLPSDLEIFSSLGSYPFDDDFCLELDDLNALITEVCPDARELRNHDCMWAGLCVNEKHDRDSIRPEKVIMPTPQKKRPAVVAPTNSRSLLLPTRPPPDRPDTPLSENELDLDLPILGDMLGMLTTVGPTEVTGQVCRPTPPPPQPPQLPQPVRTHAAPPNTDHCYFTTVLPETGTDPVKTDCLGVQTPSDSEEEIDVETVVTDPRKPGSRSSSGCSSGGLPTTPSLLDRHHLQLTVASAMNSSQSRRNTSPRYVLDRTMDDTSSSSGRVASRKRRMSASDECSGEYSRKAVKRKQYGRHKGGRSKRRRRVVVRQCGSSDSEQDSTERRSMHNNMERQRRIDLRNAFEELRVLLPETMDNEKAPKVVILTRGAQFCQDLEYMERKLLMQKAALRRHQERLRGEVSNLRRSLYMRR